MTTTVAVASGPQSAAVAHRSVRADLWAVAVPWAVARVAVLAADAVVGYLHGRVPALRSVGLLGWDAGHYRAIAAHGYTAADQSDVRFWPLTPLLSRAVHAVGIPLGASLLVVSNVAALVAGLLLLRLARRERWAAAVVDRLPWLLALAPPAYVLVMGYSEGVAIALSVAAFWCYRSGRWWLGAVAGVLSGLARPVGVLLAVPAAIEAARGWRGRSLAERGGRLVAVGAPLAGCAAYLAYIGHRFGSLTLPYRVQTSAGLHGHPGNPLRTIADALRGAHHNVGTALDVPWLALFVVLLVVMVWQLPASYTAWSAVTVAALLVGNNLDSDARYLWGTFPFLVVAARLIGRRGQLWTVTVAVSAALLVGYSVLAFTHYVVP